MTTSMQWRTALVMTGMALAVVWAGSGRRKFRWSRVNFGRSPPIR